jgi:chromosome segregation ATPase
VPLAKLSERFYQKFGHDLVEELVTWLNEMDSGSRTDLRELNELNFARFDAKLEQRIAEVKSDLRQEIAALRTEVLTALAALRTELLAAIGVQGSNLTKTGGELRTEMADLRTEMADLRTEMADVRTEMAAHRAELIKWIVGCGLGAVTVLGGLMFTLFEHFRP